MFVLKRKVITENVFHSGKGEGGLEEQQLIYNELSWVAGCVAQQRLL